MSGTLPPLEPLPSLDSLVGRYYVTGGALQVICPSVETVACSGLWFTEDPRHTQSVFSCLMFSPHPNFFFFVFVSERR